MSLPSDPIGPGEAYLAAAVETLGQSPDGRTVRNRHDGTVHTLDAAQWAVLSRCGRFRTREAHLAHLAQAPSVPPSVPPSGAVAAVLDGLVAAGLLRARREFLAAARSAPQDAGAPARITACGWVTRDRPDLLLRSVRSLVANNRQHGRDPGYQVCDDTRDPQARVATRTALGALARESGVRIHYAGAEEKERYLRALSAAARRRGIAEAVVRFALLPAAEGAEAVPTTGANHNAMCLGTAGEALLTLDDDIEVAPARLREGRAELALSSDPLPNALYPLLEPGEADRYVAPWDVSLLAEHERLLGRSVAALLGGRKDDELDLSALGPAFGLRLEASGARVAITMGGAYGDSGMGNARMLFVLDGGAREAALRSESDYRTVVTRHLAVNVAPAATVADGIALMSMNLGLDNRDCLPPHLPVHRTHDTALGATLRRTVSGGLIAYLPVALRHTPPHPRSTSPAELLDPRPTTGGLFALLVEPHRPAGDDLRAGLNSLGAHLHGLAALPVAELRAWVRGRWAWHAERLSAHLHGLLERHGGEPGYWAADVQAYLDNLHTSVEDPHGTLPAELLPAAGSPTDEGWRCLQALVGDFASLLQAWPELHDLARSLRDQGVCIAQPV